MATTNNNLIGRTDEHGRYVGTYKDHEAYLQARHKYEKKVKSDPEALQHRRLRQYRAYGLNFFNTDYVTEEEINEYTNYMSLIATQRIYAMQNGMFKGKDESYPERRTKRFPLLDNNSDAEKKARRRRSQLRSSAFTYLKYSPMTVAEIEKYISEIKDAAAQKISELNS